MFFIKLPEQIFKEKNDISKLKNNKKGESRKNEVKSYGTKTKYSIDRKRKRKNAARDNEHSGQKKSGMKPLPVI